MRPAAWSRAIPRLLERNFRTGMGVADFAAALGVTPTHLTRCCNTACGRPAIGLLQDRRIFEARKLLAETRIPVGRIAEQLGFNSPAYFTRAFQHLTGKSPSAFRRRRLIAAFAITAVDREFDQVDVANATPKRRKQSLT